MLLFFGAAFFWRAFQTWRATGVNPYRLTNPSGIHGLAGRVYSLVSIGTVLVISLYSFSEAVYSYLAPITWMQVNGVQWTGAAVLVLSLVWILVAQAQMGDSWRIGIDEENRTTLVTHGVFGISRNPIFLGVRLELLCLFLALPNAATLALWLLGDVMLQVQVFLEEE